ncbi:hypothetical protein OC834_006325 [Tilletia horrida]|nr:hypothetical protein OC834_006325 [Tilletia horrida]
MRSSATAALLLAASAATFANAHFTLDSPKSFGFDEDKEGTVPCGGFTIDGATRSPWYYKGGPVQLDSHHDTATVNIRISYAANPSTAEDFTAIPALKENLALKGQGEFCFTVDASAATPPQGTTLAAGTNATLLVEFISTVHGALYQCAAVTFVDSAAAGTGANLNCTNSLTASAAPAGSSGDDDHNDGDGHDHSSTTGASAPPASSTTSGAAAGATSGSSNNTGAGVRQASFLGGSAAAALLAVAGAAGVAALL